MQKYEHGLQDDIGYWLSRLRIKVHSGFENKLKKKRISIAQWCILISLYNEDASSVIELAKFIDVDKGSISRVVDKLVATGFIIRNAGKDRRSTDLQLSGKGEKLAIELAKLAEDNEKEFFSCLNKVEKKQLQMIFKKLLKSAGIFPLGGYLADE